MATFRCFFDKSWKADERGLDDKCAASVRDVERGGVCGGRTKRVLGDTGHGLQKSS